MQPSPSDLRAAVDRWVAAGTLTNDQAARVRAELDSQAPQRGALLGEGLGYVGGVLTLIGLVLVLSLTWDDLTPVGRTGTGAGITAALLAAGFAIPVRRLGRSGPRLRGALWLLSSTTVFATLLEWLSEVQRREVSATTVLISAGGAAAVSAGLWALNRHTLQHFATVLSLSVAAGATGQLASPHADASFAIGLAVWGFGVVWFVLSEVGVLPRQTGGVLGALVATTGGILLLVPEDGSLIALGTVLALVVVGVARRSLGVLGIGSAGTLIVLPTVVNKYLDGDVIATALALVVTGLALVAAGVFTARRRRPATPATSSGAAAPAPALDRWVAAGIVTPEQAEQLRTSLEQHGRGSLVAEGLGYAGGAIVLTGLGLFVGWSWVDLSSAAKVAVTAAAAVAFVVAGSVVPTARLGAAGARLRGVLWGLAAVATFLSLGLVADGILHWREERIMLLGGAGALVVSAVLWTRNRHILQQLTTVSALVLVAYWGAYLAVPANPDLAAGLAVWGVGAVWFVLSLTGAVAARGGSVLGAIAVILGGLLVMGESWGPAFAIGTVVAVIAAAVLRREPAVLAVGSLGTLVVLPFVIDRYLQGRTLTTALALVAAGLALIVTGVLTASRRTGATD